MANATNTTDIVVDNDDDTLIAGISAYLPMFCVTLALYAVLHTLFRRYFYTNIRRGTGPAIPSRGNLCGWLFCVPMLRGRDGALLDEPREAPLWRMSDDELVEHVKLDAFALLLFIRVAMVVLGGYALYGATVSLIVTYVSAVVEESGAYEGPPGNLARLSLANLKEFRGGDIFGEAATWDIWLAAIASVVGCWLFGVARHTGEAPEPRGRGRAGASGEKGQGRHRGQAAGEAQPLGRWRRQPRGEEGGGGEEEAQGAAQAGVRPEESLLEDDGLAGVHPAEHRHG